MDELTWDQLSGRYVIFSCLGIGIVLYLISPKFAFEAKTFALNLYIMVMSLLIVPVMLLRGRDVENVKWCCRGMYPGRWIFGLKGRVQNAENMILNEPCVIVSNHQSTVDLFGMADLSTTRTTHLVKKELMYYGHIGLCFWLAGAIFIDRKDGSGKNVMKRCAEEILDRNLQIWIFPEGTRYTKGGMLPFKKGAFNLAVTAQVPIVPVVFKSFSDFYDPDKNVFKSGEYFVEVMPPVSTIGLQDSDVPKLADDIRRMMLETYHRLSN